MALNSYMTLTGDTQGDIRGSVTQAGREGMVEVIGWSHEVVSPRDAASGLPTGRRQHKPLTITKSLDRATPLLAQAHARNERFRNVTLRVWRPNRTGRETQYFTIALTNAKIVHIRMEMLNNKYPENMRHEAREHISFTYESITETWEDGGVTSSDDWGRSTTRRRR